MAPTATSIVTTQAVSKVKSDSGNQGNVLNDDVYSDGSNDLFQMPTFPDKHAERKWAKEHMAAAFRVFAKLGYADAASGHISLRDPVDPSCFWISKYTLVTHRY